MKGLVLRGFRHSLEVLKISLDDVGRTTANKNLVHYVDKYGLWT
jgi:hypothetical protein